MIKALFVVALAAVACVAAVDESDELFKATIPDGQTKSVTCPGKRTVFVDIADYKSPNNARNCEPTPIFLAAKCYKLKTCQIQANDPERGACGKRPLIIEYRCFTNPPDLPAMGGVPDELL